MCPYMENLDVCPYMGNLVVCPHVGKPYSVSIHEKPWGVSIHGKHGCVSIPESVSEGGCPYMKSLGSVHTQGVNKGKGNVHTRKSECAPRFVSILDSVKNGLVYISYAYVCLCTPTRFLYFVARIVAPSRELCPGGWWMFYGCYTMSQPIFP